MIIIRQTDAQLPEFFTRYTLVFARRRPPRYYRRSDGDLFLRLALVVDHQERQKHNRRSDPVERARVLRLENNLAHQ